MNVNLLRSVNLHTDSCYEQKKRWYFACEQNKIEPEGWSSIAAWKKAKGIQFIIENVHQVLWFLRCSSDVETSVEVSGW